VGKDKQGMEEQDNVVSFSEYEHGHKDNRHTFDTVYICGGILSRRGRHCRGGDQRLAGFGRTKRY
jgi:surface antigen